MRKKQTNRPEREGRPPRLVVRVYQQDWMPGFACFLAGSVRKNARAVIGLNVGAMMAAVQCKDIPAKEIPYFVAESLMHEIMHALEEWAGVEFSEKRVHRLLQKYQKAAYQEGVQNGKSI